MILKVFEAGEYPQGNYPVERTKKIVDSYDPQNFIEACAVVGHFDNFLAEREENELAHGWVKSLSMNERGEVYADIPNETISRNLAGWIVTKQLRYISAEILPFDEVDPKQSPYLGRVAFLGRSIPQIPTTKIPSAFGRALSLFGLTQKKEPENNRFSWTGKIEKDAVEELKKFYGEDLLTSKTNFKEDKNGGRTRESGLQTDNPSANFNQGEEMDEEEAKALREENQRLQTENTNLQTKVNEFESKEHDKDTSAKLEKFRDKGKILPAKFDSIKEKVIKMSPEAQELFFSTLEDSAAVVELDGDHFASKTNASESGASGITDKIRAFAKDNGLSYEGAWNRLKKENPELFEEV